MALKQLFPVILLILIALALPYLAPYDAMATNTEYLLAPPSTQHPFGTDGLGRDVLSRTLVGGQRTIFTALAATLIGTTLGFCIGIMTGFIGGRVDSVGQILVNVLLSIPAFLTALMVITLIGVGWGGLVLALGVSQIAPCIQVARSAALSISNRLYIESGRAVGAGEYYLLRYYVLPNTVPLLTRYAGLVFAYTILNGASLTFLGLGGEPGIPEWGIMLAEGREVLRQAIWVSAAPGSAISLLVWAVNTWADRVSRHE